MAQITLTKNKFITEEQFKHLEKTCTRNLTDRKAVFVLLAAYTGARRVEVSRVSQADVSSDSVYIRAAKGSLDREIPIPDFLVKAIRDLKDDKPFDRHAATLDHWWHWYRPAKKGLHCLRHTMALRLYKKSKDIRLVKYLLGHKSILNTMVYADYAYSQDELRKALIDSVSA